MWIDRGRPGQPVTCQAIPIRELELNIDSNGCIDDRFVSRWVRRRYLKQLFPREQLPPRVLRSDRKDLQKASGSTSPGASGSSCSGTTGKRKAWLHAVTVEPTS